MHCCLPFCGHWIPFGQTIIQLPHPLIPANGPSLKIPCTSQPNVCVLPIQDHSHKPEEFYDIVERVSPGPYLELFARRRRHGWTAWGNEIDSDVAIPGYPVPKYSGTILSALSDSKNREEKKNNEF